MVDGGVWGCVWSERGRGRRSNVPGFVSLQESLACNVPAFVSLRESPRSTLLDFSLLVFLLDSVSGCSVSELVCAVPLYFLPPFWTVSVLSEETGVCVLEDRPEGVDGGGGGVSWILGSANGFSELLLRRGAGGALAVLARAVLSSRMSDDPRCTRDVEAGRRLRRRVRCVDASSDAEAVHCRTSELRDLRNALDVRNRSRVDCIRKMSGAAGMLLRSMSSALL
mmetsp:Transcript_7313/g.15182  ORF Transcript_7313/g.15182 Transcript_7313/m.15182 type:complete len:224 (-) Transcript_7313:34-705(-)